MFQKIANHRANDVHRPPLSITPTLFLAILPGIYLQRSVALFPDCYFKESLVMVTVIDKKTKTKISTVINPTAKSQRLIEIWVFWYQGCNVCDFYFPPEETSQASLLSFSLTALNVNLDPIVLSPIPPPVQFRPRNLQVLIFPKEILTSSSLVHILTKLFLLILTLLLLWVRIQTLALCGILSFSCK